MRGASRTTSALERERNGFGKPRVTEDSAFLSPPAIPHPARDEPDLTPHTHGPTTGYDGSKRVAIPFLDALRRKRGGRESAALKRPAAGRPSSRDEVGLPPTWYASSIASSSNSESRVCWSLCCPVAIAPP